MPKQGKMSKKLLVLGGSGFIGSAICKYALSQGLQVTSVSRGGAPKDLTVWQKQVNYIATSALEPNLYAQALSECDGIVHTIGTLIDSRMSFSRRKDYEGSYEQMNRDTALRVLEKIENSNKAFVYISAERGLFFSPRYLSTKREVEEYLHSHSDRIPYSILRPGIIYNDTNSIKKILASTVDSSKFVEDKLLSRIGLGPIAEKVLPSGSLHVDILAKVAVLGAYRPELKFSTMNVREIRETAQRFNSIN